MTIAVGTKVVWHDRHDYGGRYPIRGTVTNIELLRGQFWDGTFVPSDSGAWPVCTVTDAIGGTWTCGAQELELDPCPDDREASTDG
jgi:hypothetical protein